MDSKSHHQGLRQRVARVFLWLLGGAQTRDQYTQSARHQADGFVRGPQDADAAQRVMTQQREAYERQQQGGRYGR